MFDLGRLLSVLRSQDVEFIIVGGVAAALQGAPVLTQDMDVLYRIDEGNLQRLRTALHELNAVSRDDPSKLPFNESHLRTKGHKLAMTDAGALDIFGSLNNGVVYEDLFEFTQELEVAGVAVRVLSLEHLIELKRQLGRPKDVAMLPVLEATLRERDRA